MRDIKRFKDVPFIYEDDDLEYFFDIEFGLGTNYDKIIVYLKEKKMDLFFWKSYRKIVIGSGDIISTTKGYELDYFKKSIDLIVRKYKNKIDSLLGWDGYIGDPDIKKSKLRKSRIDQIVN